MDQPHPLELLTNHLPDSIKELLTVITADDAVVLIKAYGGTRLTVPDHPYTEHPLAGLISMDNFSKLCARYQGETLTIARCVSAITALQDRLILKDARAGRTLAQLAIQYKMTERGISKALRRIEKQEYQPWVKQAAGWSQGDLFNDH